MPKVLSWNTIHLHVFHMHLVKLGKRWVLHMGQEILTTFQEHFILPLKKGPLGQWLSTTIFASPGFIKLNADINEAFLNALTHSWSCAYLCIFVFGFCMLPLCSSYRLCFISFPSCCVLGVFWWVADINLSYNGVLASLAYPTFVYYKMTSLNNGRWRGLNELRHQADGNLPC